VNYYRLADNLRTLAKLKWVMEQSLTKTLAAKHQISVRKVYQKYHADLDINGKTYKGLQVTVSREGKKPLVATWGGIPLIWDINAPIDDQIKPYQWNKSELEKRLLAQTCEQCGATRATDRIEVHHTRALKDLEKYTGREKPQWVETHGFPQAEDAGTLPYLPYGHSIRTPTETRGITFTDRQNLMILESVVR
jgi:hypothetical protein